MRQRLVPGEGPCAGWRSRGRIARRLRRRAPGRRPRARGLAGDVARRRAALLAVAPLRPAPAARRNAGACARSGAFPPRAGIAHRPAIALERLMQARIVGARQGAAWLVDGWRLFRAAPLGWLAMVFGYWIIMTLASVVPFIGVAAASIMVPAFSVGFMAAARAAARGGPVELTLLFDGFRHQPKSQLVLGVIYLMCLGTLLSVTTLVDDGALASW